MRTDHDTNYKQLFAHPEMVCELLAGFLPTSFAGRLDMAGCQRINGSYASEAGHQRHDDMVWQVCRGDDPAGVLVLLEFQSQPDRWMALRMHVYAGLLQQDFLKQTTVSDGELPLVLPVVVYSGERAWTCGTSLAALRRNDDGLDCYQPELRYLLIDLVRESGAAGAGNVVLALFQCTPSGAAEYLPPALECIAKWLEGQRRAVLRRAVTRWVTRHLRARFKRINIPWNCTLEEVHAMYARRFETFEDQLAFELKQKSRQEGLEEGRQVGLNEGRQVGLNEGRQEGLKEGRHVGMEEGRQQVLRDMLTQLLERGGGPLPAFAAERISAAGSDQLQQWVDQVIAQQRPASLLEL